MNVDLYSQWVGDVRAVGLFAVCLILCKKNDAIAQSFVASIMHKNYRNNVSFIFPDEIHESSGLAISKKNPGIFWTHNDSKAEPTIYAIDMSAGIVSKLHLKSVINNDFEDIALAPCSQEKLESSCLFIADIGTNRSNGKNSHIHLIKEPDLSDTDITEKHAEPLITVEFYYEDNIMYNAESLAITEDLDFLIITKGSDTANAVLYRLPYEIWSTNYADGPLPLAREFILFEDIDTTFGQVTAASYSNGILGVKTYSHVYFFDKPNQQETNWSQNRKPCFVFHLSIIGEGFDFDSNRVYISSENLLARHIGFFDSDKIVQKGRITSFVCKPRR